LPNAADRCVCWCFCRLAIQARPEEPNKPAKTQQVYYEQLKKALLLAFEQRGTKAALIKIQN